MKRVYTLMLILITCLVLAAWPQARKEAEIITLDPPGTRTGSGQGATPEQNTPAGMELTAVATEWTQYGFLPTHTSFNGHETTLNRANVAGLTWQWAGEVGTSSALSAVVGRDIVYVAADGMILAFQAGDGTKLWSHLSCSGVGTVQAALGRDALLVGDAGGDLAAYDRVTGNQIWCNDESGSITSAPAVKEGTVYITNGGDVVAIDQLTGDQRWRFTPADFSLVTNTPALGQGIVYVTGGNSVFALNETNGHLLWRANLGPQANISAPSVAREAVYVGGTGLYALNTTTGRRLWVQHMVGVNVTTPAIAYNKVFVNSQDPAFGLWAFDAINGAFLWRRESPDEPGATVTVANGVVYDIADTGALMMFNTTTGAILGSIVDPQGHRFSSLFGDQLAVLNGTVYLPAENRIDAFRLP
jgi:putative pyrroloquinoline-quinone binding quinoprotein